LVPVILLRQAFSQLDPELKNRVFNWHAVAGASGVQALALGYGSLYNHANPANLLYRAAHSGMAIEFVADRDILAGEELTVNYNDAKGGTRSTEDNWFKGKGIEPV
jgi:uncharacterized protein